jgi:hypothetical protein
MAKTYWPIYMSKEREGRRGGEEEERRRKAKTGEIESNRVCQAWTRGER